MKKTLAIVLALVFVICAFSACGNTEKNDNTTNATETTAAAETTTAANGETTAASGDETTAAANDDGYELINFDGSYVTDGVLTVGMEIGYPPFEMYDSNSKPIGFDVDLANAIAKKLGLELKIVPSSFDVIFANLGTNYDCVISGVTYTAVRENYMDFSVPYINNFQCVVLKTGNKLEINGINALKNLTVGVQDSTTSDELITRYISSKTIDAEVIRSEQITTCFTSLTNGEIDAVLCDSTVAADYLSNHPGEYTIAWTQTDAPETMAIAVPTGDAKLQTNINNAIAQLKADGTINDLYAAWFSSFDAADLLPAA